MYLKNCFSACFSFVYFWQPLKYSNIYTHRDYPDIRNRSYASHRLVPCHVCYVEHLFENLLLLATNNAMKLAILGSLNFSSGVVIIRELIILLMHIFPLIFWYFPFDLLGLNEVTNQLESCHHLTIIIMILMFLNTSHMNSNTCI